MYKIKVDNEIFNASEDHIKDMIYSRDPSIWSDSKSWDWKEDAKKVGINILGERTKVKIRAEAEGLLYLKDMATKVKNIELWITYDGGDGQHYREKIGCDFHSLEINGGI